MKKVLAINHSLLIKGYLIFPTLLFAFAIVRSKSTVSFMWPFIMVYSIERMMPFLMDEHVPLTAWLGINRIYSGINFIGVILAITGIFYQIEWIASIGAVLIGIGMAGISLSPDPNKTIANFSFKKINLLAQFLALITTLLLGFLLIKWSILAAFIFYSILLVMDLFYSWCLLDLEPIKITFKGFFNRQLLEASAVFVIIFIISIFKKTGQISELNWLLIMLALVGMIIDGRHIIFKRLKLLRIWLGALRNYLIIYTLLLSFQQNTLTWIFIIFLEIIVAGIIATILKQTMNSQKVVRVFFITLLGLVLMLSEYLYLLGTGITTLGISFLSQWSSLHANDKYPSSKKKISFFGALCNQVILFGLLEVISLTNLGKKDALLLPYMVHHSDLQYSIEMLWLRIGMTLIFIITGLVIGNFELKRKKQ